MTAGNWDDLRLALAVARAGSASAAARELKIAHVTMLRRLQGMEDAHGMRLFERRSSGYSLTKAGEALVAVAEEVERSLGKARAEHGRSAQGMPHEIRLTLTDSLITEWMADLLTQFCKRHPEVHLHVIVANEMVDMESDNIDVCIRLTTKPSDKLVGMKICRVDFGLYGTAKAKIELEHSDWRNAKFVWPTSDVANAPVYRWLQKTLPKPSFQTEANSFLAVASLAAAGMGLAALPCFVGRQYSGLVEVDTVPRKYSNDLWILTHPHRKSSVGITLFLNYLMAGMKAYSDTFQSGDI